uniref:Uncharacterized protein n=1 Tax=Panagrolaimus sp. JU765 TaxID=591449 RepID=A0AC34R3R9_9BILA
MQVYIKLFEKHNKQNETRCANRRIKNFGLLVNKPSKPKMEISTMKSFVAYFSLTSLIFFVPLTMSSMRSNITDVSTAVFKT